MFSDNLDRFAASESLPVIIPDHESIWNKLPKAQPRSYGYSAYGSGLRLELALTPFSDIVGRSMYYLALLPVTLSNELLTNSSQDGSSSRRNPRCLAICLEAKSDRQNNFRRVYVPDLRLPLCVNNAGLVLTDAINQYRSGNLPQVIPSTCPPGHGHTALAKSIYIHFTTRKPVPIKFHERFSESFTRRQSLTLVPSGFLTSSGGHREIVYKEAAVCAVLENHVGTRPLSLVIREIWDPYKGEGLRIMVICDPESNFCCWIDLRSANEVLAINRRHPEGIAQTALSHNEELNPNQHADSRSEWGYVNNLVEGALRLQPDKGSLAERDDIDICSRHMDYTDTLYKVFAMAVTGRLLEVRVTWQDGKIMKIEKHELR